jgi:hypothetical protein
MMSRWAKPPPSRSDTRGDLVARDSERARIGAFLAAATESARSLVIRGEPGIGKTARWQHAVGTRRRRCARPAGAVGSVRLPDTRAARGATACQGDPRARPSVRND